jgi:hypothetical protein
MYPEHTLRMKILIKTIIVLPIVVWLCLMFGMYWARVVEESHSVQAQH